MIASDLETAHDRLRDLIGAAGAVLPFTGAGISTECGIPDFRSPGGIWTKMRRFRTTHSSRAGRCATRPGAAAFSWRSSSAPRSPGRGHLALASLYPRRQGPRGRDPEHRQSASGVGHSRPSTSSSCTATRPMPRASIAPSVTSWPGSRSDSTLAAGRRPIARTAAATSRPPPSRSARRCRRTRCGARRS